MRVLTILISALALFTCVVSAAIMPNAESQSMAPRASSGAIIGTTFNGEQYWLTFNGKGSLCTLNIATGTPSTNQLWNILGEWTIAVTPVEAPSLSASWPQGDGNHLRALPDAYAWQLKRSGDGYVIENLLSSVFWAYESPRHKTPVIFKPTGDKNSVVWFVTKNP